MDVEQNGPSAFPVWLIALAIGLITFAVYAPTLGFSFVYDDYAQIVETKQLNSWRMAPHYFTGHVWAWKTPGVPGPYYRPVFLLWLLLNQSLFGLSAPLWHLTSILTHVAATLLIFAVVKRISGDVWMAALSSIFFGVHPAHVESVAWVSGITDPLAAALMLGALLCFLDKRPALSYALFALALLEKEIAMIFPVLLAVYLWLFDRAALRKAAPYFFLLMIYLGVRLAVLQQITLTVTPMALRDMLKTWPSLLVFYLRHLAWPVGLSVFYSVPVVQKADWEHFGKPCLLLVLPTAGLAWWGWRSRWAALGAAFLVLPLLPALNLRTFAKVETVHDRYLYLPVLGFALLAALALRKIPGTALRAAAVTSIVAAFSYGAVAEGRFWKDNLTLFLHGVEAAPDNEIANQCLGTALLLNRQAVEAIPYYQRALEKNPDMFETLYSLGRIYYELRDYPKAEGYLERAIRAHPRYSFPYLYYGLSKLQEGKLDDAEKTLRFVIATKGPDDYREFHLALGLTLKAKGDRTGALHEFELEARENPDPARALREIAQLREAAP